MLLLLLLWLFLLQFLLLPILILFHSLQTQPKAIMRNLVRRYVTQEQRKSENEGVTEDDVNEIKNDISAFRFG